VTALAVFLAYVFAGAALLLFLGGMLAASYEHYRDHRDGKRLTFEAWDPAAIRARRAERRKHSAPRGSSVMWFLLAVGRPDWAERYAARRFGRAA